MTRPNYRLWTDEEITTLTTLWPHDQQKAQATLGRGYQSCSAKYREVTGGTGVLRRPWNPREDAYVLDQWDQLTPEQIGRRINRTGKAVRSRQQHLTGLTQTQRTRARRTILAKKVTPKKFKNWTPDEERAIIILRGRGVPYGDIAATLGRTTEATAQRGTKLRKRGLLP